MQAGEVNVLIQCYPYNLPAPTNPLSLIGATCHLAVRSPLDVLTDLPLIVSGDGSYAYRYTTNMDFPIGGSYNIQLIAVYTSGITLKSPIQGLNVGLTLE